MQVGGHEPYVYYILGHLFTRRGETAQAIAAFRQAWERHPSYFEAIRHLVQLHCSRGEGNAAIPYLEYAAKQGIAPVDSLLTLATLYLEEGLPEKAQHTIQMASNADRARAMSALLAQARDLPERTGTAAALALLQIGREVFPEQPQIYEVLGDLLMEQQQPRDALVCYEHLLRLSDPHPAHYCRLARAFLSMGFPVRAELAVQKARGLDRNYAEAARLWAAIYG
jgi:tetratricopeptide (TPR) repeat protein